MKVFICFSALFCQAKYALWIKIATYGTFLFCTQSIKSFRNVNCHQTLFLMELKFRMEVRKKTWEENPTKQWVMMPNNWWGLNGHRNPKMSLQWMWSEKMSSSSICLCLAQFYLAKCPPGLSVLVQMAGLPSFFKVVCIIKSGTRSLWTSW